MENRRVTDTTSYAQTGWHKLDFTRNGSDFNLFVDNANQGSTTDATFIDITGSLKIASHASVAFYWNGQVDEVRISKTTFDRDWRELEYKNQTQTSSIYVIDNGDIDNSLWSEIDII